MSKFSVVQYKSCKEVNLLRLELTIETAQGEIVTSFEVGATNVTNVQNFSRIGQLVIKIVFRGHSYLKVYGRKPYQKYEARVQ